MPIEQEIVGGGEYAGQTRYWIDRERYELRDLDLAARTRCGRCRSPIAATRPGSTLGSGGAVEARRRRARRDSAPVAAVPPDCAEPAACCATRSPARTSVRFRYRDVERTVDP